MNYLRYHLYLFDDGGADAVDDVADVVVGDVGTGGEAETYGEE
jgi:hypothetical protein